MARASDIDNRLPITASMMLASLLVTLDTTIANVALPHMQGSFSATQDQMAWVLTSYIVASAVMTLDALAVNGGRPQATEPKYYPVASTADLVAVLKTIGGQITSCTFSLGKAPPDPANIAVNAINAAGMTTRLTQSMTNGWEYGAGMTSIELFGAACDNVKSKATTDVQAIFGCPGMVIP